jgi:hypothetical protein
VPFFCVLPVSLDKAFGAVGAELNDNRIGNGSFRTYKIMYWVFSVLSKGRSDCLISGKKFLCEQCAVLLQHPLSIFRNSKVLKFYCSFLIFGSTYLTEYCFSYG